MNISMNPNSELNQSIVNVPNLVQVPDPLLKQAYQFQEAMMMYTCAIREIKTKLEVLNDELSVRNSRNPIEMVKSRVKKAHKHCGKAAAQRTAGFPGIHDGQSG